MTRFARALGVTAGALLAASAASAMTAREARKRSIQAVRLSQAPKIDGLLDDPAWKSAARVEGFYQWSPVEGAAATENTIAYLGYDDKNLYLAFEVFDSSPSKIRYSLAQREQIGDDDLVWVSLDPFNDHRTGYEFICNPLGSSAARTST